MVVCFGSFNAGRLRGNAPPGRTSLLRRFIPLWVGSEGVQGLHKRQTALAHRRYLSAEHNFSLIFSLSTAAYPLRRITQNSDSFCVISTITKNMQVFLLIMRGGYIPSLYFFSSSKPRRHRKMLVLRNYSPSTLLAARYLTYQTIAVIIYHRWVNAYEFTDSVFFSRAASRQCSDVRDRAHSFLKTSDFAVRGFLFTPPPQGEQVSSAYSYTLLSYSKYHKSDLLSIEQCSNSGRSFVYTLSAIISASAV